MGAATEQRKEQRKAPKRFDLVEGKRNWTKFKYMNKYG